MGQTLHLRPTELWQRLFRQPCGKPPTLLFGALPKTPRRRQRPIAHQYPADDRLVPYGPEVPAVPPAGRALVVALQPPAVVLPERRAFDREHRRVGHPG